MGVANSNLPKKNDIEQGFFYIVQLIPKLSPNRIKIGFTNIIKNRMQEYKRTSSNARLVKHWPCKRIWEKTVDLNRVKMPSGVSSPGIPNLRTSIARSKSSVNKNNPFDC